MILGETDRAVIFSLLVRPHWLKKGFARGTSGFLPPSTFLTRASSCRDLIGQFQFNVQIGKLDLIMLPNWEACVWGAPRGVCNSCLLTNSTSSSITPTRLLREMMKPSLSHYKLLILTLHMACFTTNTIPFCCQAH